jgi:hypothetical protein
MSKMLTAEVLAELAYYGLFDSDTFCKALLEEPKDTHSSLEFTFRDGRKFKLSVEEIKE